MFLRRAQPGFGDKMISNEGQDERKASLTILSSAIAIL